MTYKVVNEFIDLQDSGFRYSVGDSYPRPGFHVNENRIAELSTKRNKRGVQLITKVEEEQAKKPARRKVKHERDSVD